MPMTSSPQNFDVFISYSHRDAEAVMALDVALRSAGLKVFLDTRDVLAGDRLVEKVFDGIASAGAQIVVLSEASTSSSWVKDEISAGRTRSLVSGSRVIPVLIDRCELPNSIAHLKYVDLRDWLTDRSFRRGVSELLHALGASVESPKDETLQWSLKHFGELQQLSRELTYSVAHLDGGISEMTGASSRVWTSYKHALNDVRLGMFLLAIDDIAWPADARATAEWANGRGIGCLPVGSY
ncbi:MAG: toll/interleukin-1 receptor domain-containing protein [Solirubrobacterales bacterium]